MTTAARGARVVAATLAGLALAPGCFKTEVRYYTLASGPAVGRPAREDVRYTVHVAPAVVPEGLDRPELVLRVSDTQVAVDDNHRWAEPLRTGIARAVAGSLGRGLEGARVSASEQREGQAPSDVDLTIDVQRLDVSLADGVVIEVVWTARWTSDGATRTGRSAARAPGVSPGGYDAAIAACAAVLDAVGRDVARSVGMEHLSRR